MKQLTYDYIKNYINREDKLISTTYINNKTLLDIKCQYCDELYKQNYDRYKRGYRHNNCCNKLKYISKIINFKICEFCNIEYISKRKNQKLCSAKCANYKLVNNTKINKDRGRLGGEKAIVLLTDEVKVKYYFMIYAVYILINLMYYQIKKYLLIKMAEDGMLI